MKKISKICFLCAAVVLGSCTSDVPGIDGEQDLSAPVRFITTDADGATRGTPITDASQLTTLGIFASYTGTADWSNTTSTPNKMFNQRLNYSSGTWSYPTGDEEYWDYLSLADRYTFFAYAPYGTDVYNNTTNAEGNGIEMSSANGDAGVPVLRYTVPTKVENQPDLMVAVPKKNIRPTGSPISLVMEHALTCVGFQIAGNGERVTGIKVQGVSTTGTLAIDGGAISWNVSAPTTTDFSASLNYDEGKTYYTTTSNMSTSLIKDSGYLMMIPQTLQAGAKVIVTYSSGATKELNFGTDTWLPGQRLSYNITLPDDATPTTDGGELAPPGVIGYIKGTNELTLKGSTEYRYATNANADSNNDGVGDIEQFAIDNFNGLSDQTVYVAYFKYGSLVAIGGDDVSAAFDPLDIVAAPSEWEGPLQAARDYIGSNWSLVPRATENYEATSATTYAGYGYGDACKYYFGSKYAGGWALPTGTRYNGEPKYDNTINMERYTSEDVSTGLPVLGTGLPGGVMSKRNGETGMFYAYTGYRDQSGQKTVAYDGLPRNPRFAYRSSTKSGNNDYVFYFQETSYSAMVEPDHYVAYSNDTYAYAVRCVRPFATISLNPSTTPEFPVNGDTRTFEIILSYFTGTPKVTTNAPSWVTATIEGNTLTVTVAANTTSTDRAASITLTAGSYTGTTTTLNITQSHTMGGMLAPPGVIGYVKGTNRLTLKGSQEYDSNTNIKNYAIANFGGLENETVYVAYFKFGSLVALSSDPNDTGKGLNANYVQSNDIIKGPEGYDLATLQSNMNSYNNANNVWVTVPVYPKATTIGSQDAPLDGRGDPCRYYFGTEYQTGDGFDPAYSWRLPRGNNYNHYTASEMSAWQNASSTLPVAGVFSTRSGETGMFYPITGYRNENNGQVFNQNTTGLFWSSDSNGGDYSYDLYINSNDNPPTHLYNTDWIGRGHAVRCVKDAPTISIVPSAYTFPTKEAASTSVDVTTTKYRGDIFVSTPYSWIKAVVDQETKTVTVSVDENTDTGALNNPYRSGYVDISVGTPYTGYDYRRFSIAQRHTVGGVLAPPGVIGYVKGTNRLTLQGSKEYKSNSSINNYAIENFGSLSDSTVYVAYFKWGSLVAMSGDPLDVNTEGGRYLQSEDIVAGPADDWAGYSTLKNTAYPSWGAIPYTSASSITPDYTNGKGDPCVYYFGDKYQSGKGFDTAHSWRMPALENVTSNGYNNWWFNGYMPNFWDGTWYNASGSIPQGRYSVRTGESGMFYPATGYRESSDDGSGSGQIKDQSYRAIYWTKTYLTDNKSYYLEFDSSAPGWLDNSYYRFRGFPVRCVKDRPTVSVPSTSYSFPAPATTATIQITTANYSIAPEVSVSPANSWLTVTPEPGTEAGKYTLKVELDEYMTTTSDRTGYIFLRVGSSWTGYDEKYIYITQRHSVGGVFAPPGVIGYIQNTGELTLKGSKEFKTAIPTDSNQDGTTDVEQYAIDNFGGLSTETVYVAYFKYGSLIAISGDLFDKSRNTNNSYVQTDDIIAGPSEWTNYGGSYNSLKNNPTWESIPVWHDLGYNTVNQNYVSRGLGDPCVYYFSNPDKYETVGWKLPKGNPYNNRSQWDTNNMERMYPVGHEFAGWRDKSNQGVYYILSGTRQRKDDGNPGMVEKQFNEAFYWTYSSGGGWDAYYMHMDGSNIYPQDYWNVDRAGAVRCFNTPPSISVSSSTASFAAAGETKTFTVTTSNFNGTPKVKKVGDSSDTSASWITASVSGNTLTVTATANTVTTSRSATLTISAGPATATVTVTQAAYVAPVPTTPAGGVAAVPGVLAVDSQGRLNLDGNGYIVYFKWGSTIAISGNTTNGDIFDASDIAWVPQGYNFGALKTSIGSTTGETAWGKIPYSTGDEITESNTAGTGDPCKQIAGGGWRMPTNQENIDFIGLGDQQPFNGQSYDGKVYYNWNGHSGNASDPGIGTFSQGTAAGTSLPAMGYRLYLDGGLYTVGSRGYYWSATCFGGTSGYMLYFDDEYTYPSGTAVKRYAMPVRCVPK